jgi:hypothetical protein
VIISISYPRGNGIAAGGCDVCDVIVEDGLPYGFRSGFLFGVGLFLKKSPQQVPGKLQAPTKPFDSIVEDSHIRHFGYRSRTSAKVCLSQKHLGSALHE